MSLIPLGERGTGRHEDCVYCLASGNPRGCKAGGHYAPTAAEIEALANESRERAERRAERPACRVCGSPDCLAARERGRPMLCD